jgi:cytochrome c oxidase assembly factor CtaG
MNSGAADVRPPARGAPWRPWCLSGAALVLVVGLVPPLSEAARHSEYVATLQFSLFAIVVPALVVAGAPWRLLRLADAGGAANPPRITDRIADRRRRHRELPWSLAFIACDLGVAVAWHTPGAVGAVVRHGWLAVPEAASLLIFGLGLWLELVASPPLAPRSGYLRRAVLAAFAMWAFWVLAYVVGLSDHDVYRNFHHAAGGLSAPADQQIASAVLWFVAAVAFAPVIFWNALTWLKTEEDPDAELVALTKAERRRGLPPATRKSGGGAPAT